MSRLWQVFPRLTKRNCAITSPATEDYNCIAWAASDAQRWWWPTGRYFWPVSAPREETIEAFESAYRTLGYRKCNSGDLEPGFQKVALYVDASGTPTHAARQLPNGRWTSKCGGLEDIEHDLDGLVGATYGSVGLFLKKPE